MLFPNLVVYPHMKNLVITILALLTAAVFAQDDSFIYVTNEDSNNVSVISGATNEVVATIPVGKRPRGIKVSPNGSVFYVALSGSPKCPPAMDDHVCEAMEADKAADGIAEVNTVTHEVVRILPSGSDPEQFDVDWNTRRLYVSNEDIHMASILDLDAGEILMQVPTGLEPEGVRLSPDGSLVYVTGEVASDITVINAASGEEIARIDVGLRPRDMAQQLIRRKFQYPRFHHLVMHLFPTQILLVGEIG